MPQADNDQPAYVRVADKLRRRIDAGIFGVGMLLPSENAIAKEFGVSRNSVRPALDILRREGKVITAVGRGTIVRAPAPSRVISISSYQNDINTAATATYPPVPLVDPELDPHRPTVELTEVTATAELAQLFGVAAGTMLSRRHLVHRIAGHPVQMTTSYYLLDLVAGTWVATPGSEPSPGGAVGHLWALGVHVRRVRKRLVSRPPTAAEAQTLRMDGGHVLAITRQMLTADGQVVEVAQQIVIPSHGVEVEYEIELLPPS